MYYRRKILLSLLQLFDNKLDKISFQKLLFLVARNQNKTSFHFVPYKFGCYSFQANSDLHTLTKYSLISELEKQWKKIDEKDYLCELKREDQRALRMVKNLYGKLTKDELITLTYRKYPYFAINSTIAENVLSQEENSKVEKQRPTKKETILFTIGYEGIALEQYLNKLLINNVKVLCDVRKNSFSMKYGFSKSQLQNACKNVGIEFIHIPEVGIESVKRQKLNSQKDYDKLFAFYQKTVLSSQIKKQMEILQLLKAKKRIALTCFEANICQCHRKHLAESIEKLEGFSFEVKHI